MYTIRRAEISGLWDVCNAIMDFRDDVNFLIGPNGTGKTTIINILDAALNPGTGATLAALPFAWATIQLSEVSSGKTATLKVAKAGTEGLPIHYSLEESNLPSSEEVLTGRRRTRFAPAERVPESASVPLTTRQRVRQIVNKRLLSVHRAAVYSGREERSYESTVDIKLDQVNGDFVKFYSSLSNRRTSRLLEFVNLFFLSAITVPSFNIVSGVVEDLDVEREAGTIAGMFETLSVDPSAYKPRLDAFMQALRQSLKKQKEDQTLSGDEIGTVFAITRLRNLEQEWGAMMGDQDEIMKPVIDFESVLKRLFTRKTVGVDEENELLVTLDTGQPLELRLLSSGEKQMIILLAEALLQQREPWVYLADEPELSLHVRWQEQLVSSLREINPNAQLIFATHSPDIVSTFSDRAINMEDVLKW